MSRPSHGSSEDGNHSLLRSGWSLSTWGNSHMLWWSWFINLWTVVKTFDRRSHITIQITTIVRSNSWFPTLNRTIIITLCAPHLDTIITTSSVPPTVCKSRRLRSYMIGTQSGYPRFVRFEWFIYLYIVTQFSSRFRTTEAIIRY